jgi:hypothetical protein
MEATMRAELLETLRAIARGEHAAKNPVTPATPVTGITGYRSELPELQALQQLQAKAGKVAKSGFSPVTAPVTVVLETDEAAIEQRAGLAADRVPPAYLDAWARLNCQKPASVSETEWRLALDDGGQFLDAWGNEAADMGWTPGDLFDVTAGLAWRLAGERIEAIGADRARLSDGRTIMRRTLASDLEWRNRDAAADQA